MHCFTLFVQPSEGWDSSTAPDRSRCKGWNPGILFLQLQDGGDWPQAGRAEGTGAFPRSAQSISAAGLSSQAGLGTGAAPLLLLTAQLQSRTSRNLHLLCCNPLQQGPSSDAQPQTPKSKHRCLDSGMQPPCATPSSPAPVCDFFLVPVRRFFRREVRHTKYLQKELKCFIPLAFLQQKNSF